MRKYGARMLDAATGGEGSYTFHYDGDLFKETADEVIHQFFEHVDKTVFAHHVDYEINASFKNKERRVVTAIGSLIIVRGGKEEEMPFLLMVSEA
ncbi:MAG: hypothetical protein NW215_02030 [Hyphomicrobiales bacterium]|nr:hypothetical protein [Hyphomicrobiales bacterium]